MFYEEVKLEAIWLENPVVVNKYDEKSRIVRGDMVRIQNGMIVNSSPKEKPTHVITELTGSIDSTNLKMGLMNLISYELETIKI